MVAPQSQPLPIYTAPEANKAVMLFAQQQAEYAKSGIMVKTGFPSVDAGIPSLVPGDLVIFHGMTGEGKTTVVQRAIKNMASQIQARKGLRSDGRDPRIMYVPTEELVEVLRTRMWNDRNLTVRQLVEGKASQSDIERLSISSSADPIVFVGQAEMSEKINPEAVEDFGAVTVDGIAAAFYKLVKEGIAPEIVVIDHLHDITLRGMQRSMNDTELVASVFRQLAWFKNWSKSIVVLVCQDNDKAINMRDPEQRQPMRTDISNSTSVIRKAAAVISVWKPSRSLCLGTGDVHPLERLTKHGRQIINVTKDTILLELQKTRYSDAEGQTVVLSGRGTTGVWGDVTEVDTAKWPKSSGPDQKTATVIQPNRDQKRPKKQSEQEDDLIITDYNMQ